jgi:hypothetical protein
MLILLYVILVIHSTLDRHVYIWVYHSVTFTGVVIQSLNLFIDGTCRQIQFVLHRKLKLTFQMYTLNLFFFFDEPT